MLRLVARLDAFLGLRPRPGARTPDVHALAHAALLGGADAVRLALADGTDARSLLERLDGAVELDVVPGGPEVDLALTLKAERVCLVPAAATPAETTTRDAARLRAAGLAVALRVAPTEEALLAANEVGVAWADLDTGPFARAGSEGLRVKEFLALGRAARSAREMGLRVTLGGGLKPGTLARVASLPEAEELHVGFELLARALHVGVTSAMSAFRDDALRARVLSSTGAEG